MLHNIKPISVMESDIIAEFEALTDIDAKYAHLFKIGEALPELDPKYKTEDFRVKGCESTVWFFLRNDNGKLSLEADSDSMLIKGITALLVRIIANRGPGDLHELSLDFLNEIDIWKLPSQRNSGLMAMLDHIKTQAKSIQQSEGQAAE